MVCTTLSVSRYNNHQMLTLDNLTQTGVSPEDFLPTQDPEDNLKGMRELYRNPHYLYLLARLAVEERQSTEEVCRGGVNESVEQHFKHIGLVLGLVRIKDLHMGQIADLETTVKELTQNERTNERPEPGEPGGHTSTTDA